LTASRQQSGNTRSELNAALARCRSAFFAIAGFSAILNILALTGSMFMMEVYDRVYGRKLTRPYDTTFGDGEPFDPADVQSLYPILDRLEVDFAWRNGDLMLLDNFYTFHGRSPFTGDRDVQVALIG